METKVAGIETVIGEKISALRNAEPVRIAAPELGGDIVVILAATHEDTLTVLQETIDDLKEQAAWQGANRRALKSLLDD